VVAVAAMMMMGVEGGLQMESYGFPITRYHPLFLVPPLIATTPRREGGLSPPKGVLTQLAITKGGSEYPLFDRPTTDHPPPPLLKDDARTSSPSSEPDPLVVGGTRSWNCHRETELVTDLASYAGRIDGTKEG
jgi:hypothetical protein